MVFLFFPSPRQQAEFLGQLAALLEAGIPLSRAFPLVAKGSLRGYGPYCTQVGQALDQGQSFAVALRRVPRPGPFTPWQCSLLEVAESSGALAQMCKQLADQCWANQKRDRYRRAVLQSLGTFMAGGIIGIGALLRLPLGISALILLFSLGSMAALFCLPRLEAWRRAIPILRHYDEIQFTLKLTELALPLQCGLSVLAALDLLSRHLPAGRLKRTLHHGTTQIQRGASLSQALDKQIPPVLAQYLRTGEESGSVESLLMKVADYSDSELETLLKRTQGILQPLSLLGWGAIVLVLGIGMIQTLLQNLSLGD